MNNTLMDDQREDHTDPKRPEQPQTTIGPNVPSGDVENKRTRDTEKLLYIDQHILNENKTRRKNIAMAWIDYKKAYNMVSQSWILYCRQMYKIPDQVVHVIEKTTETWRVDLTVKGKSLAEVEILRGIFYHNYYLW